MNTGQTFPAKLLLFGEYSVLSGSRALAIPLRLWEGKLSSGGDGVDQDLLRFSDFMHGLEMFSAKGRHAFAVAVQEGLTFRSDIPRGYGAGSSGALCAAVYAAFFHEGREQDIAVLRMRLAIMEAYFHGTSSGMDPLVSYLRAPVLREGDQYHVLPALQWPAGIRIFLIDTGVPRRTETLVQDYHALSTDRKFDLECIRPLVQSVDHAISFFLDGHTEALWEHLSLISEIQYKWFRPMITEYILPVWETACGHPNLVIKLCGAGGGGFYLGFARGDVDLNQISDFDFIEVLL